MWGCCDTTKALKLIQKNSGAKEILHKFPMKVYFDIDKTENLKPDDLTTYKNIILKHIPDAMMAISGSETDQKHSYHITLTNYTFKNEQERDDFKLFVKTVLHIEDNGFDTAVYTKNRNMKCVNQSKPEDKRVQEIIEDDDIKNHLISAFISDDCKSVKLPEDIVVKAQQKSKEKRNKWCPSFDYLFLKVTSNGNVEKIKIEIENAYPKHAKLSIDKDGNFYILGYFTEKEKRDVFRLEHGIFFHKYNSKGDRIFRKKDSWGKDFYTKLKEEYNLDKESEEADGFYIDGISIDYQQNSISLISTHRYQNFANSNNGGKTTTSRYNYANHVIISSFDFDANLNWTSCLEKRSNPRSFYSNMIFGNHNGKIYLIFNASKTLDERTESGIKNKYSARFTDFARINSKGEIEEQKTIFNSKETGVYFYPQYSSFIEKGIFLLFGRDNKNARLGLMKLP